MEDYVSTASEVSKEWLEGSVWIEDILAGSPSI